MKPLDVTVQIGAPITVAELGSKETQVIQQAVLAEMKRLIENSPQGDGVSIRSHRVPSPLGRGLG